MIMLLRMLMKRNPPFFFIYTFELEMDSGIAFDVFEGAGYQSASDVWVISGDL